MWLDVSLRVNVFFCVSKLFQLLKGSKRKEIVEAAGMNIVEAEKLKAYSNRANKYIALNQTLNFSPLQLAVSFPPCAKSEIFIGNKHEQIILSFFVPGFVARDVLRQFIIVCVID